MAFAPKDQSTILRNLLALVINRTELNDIAPGSVLYTLLAGVANELAATERRIEAVRDGFFLDNLSGVALDERVAEFPIGGITRRGASVASGASLSLTRDPATSASVLVIPAGSKVSSTANGLTYSTLSDIVFSAGESFKQNIYIYCDTARSQGNIQAGLITQSVDLDSSIISVNNLIPLTNGRDTESDVSLKRRASKYLESLGRTQISALEYLALSFQPSDGSRFSFTTVFEDPSQPAYSELLVDDGSGLSIESVSRLGSVESTTVPSGGQNILFHESPAVAPITSANILITRGVSTITIPDSQIISIPERGIVYLPDGLLQPGDVWSIRDYRVFLGPIAELQAEVEGNNSLSRISGFRAAGCRVVVRPPELQEVAFDLAINSDRAFDLKTVEYKVKQAIINFISTLGINSPLYVSNIITAALNVPGVLDVEVLRSGERLRLSTIYPQSRKSIIRTNSNLINITSRILED